jgi:asparagine synthase (glutamine-hydrolysing)
MCGIAGILDCTFRDSKEHLKQNIMDMTNTMVNRGPDSAGYWVDDQVGIALGHRRLAIIDLSAEGQQPMVSSSGRYVMSFNGEVYNYKTLRNNLESKGYPFRGHSDTEVALASIEYWGLEQAVQKFVGMFAFALWDKQSLKLYLVRDRLGEKPLYYGWVRKNFLFASELKALTVHPDFGAEIDRNALALYLRYNCIPAPYSIYKGIYKLLPGCILTITSDQPGVIPEPIDYWSMRCVAEKGNQNLFSGSEQEAISELDELLRDSVKSKMVSDVPLGAFLSGGIDSSTIVALMQAQSSRPIKTFTIGLHESDYNEAHHAKRIAKHLGTDHTELYLDPQDIINVIPNIPTLYDEPFADSSQIPSYLVAQMARQHVTVALSGDGGDELFAGYNRHVWIPRIWNKTSWLPLPLRRKLAVWLQLKSPAQWNEIYKKFKVFLPSQYRQRVPGDKLHKLAGVLASKNPQEMYYGLVSHWRNPEGIVIGSTEPETVVTDNRRWASLDGLVEQIMFLDSVSYLPDDILVKVDRACMGVSLESRAPYLDHRVVEYAWRLPISMKLKDGQSKWILRQVLYKYVPQELTDQPKMGFGIPLDSWLREPLRDWAEFLLDAKRLREEGFFQPEPIREKWQEHLSGQRNWQHHLWDILMFESWLENQKRG